MEDFGGHHHVRLIQGRRFKWGFRIYYPPSIPPGIWGFRKEIWRVCNRLAIGNSPLKFWNLTRALWCERKPPSFFLSTLCPSLLLTYTILQFLFKTFNQLAEPPMSKCMNYPWCMYAEIIMSEPLTVIVTMFKFIGSNWLNQTYKNVNCKYSQLDNLGAGIDVIGEMKKKSTSAPSSSSIQEDTPIWILEALINII